MAASPNRLPPAASRRWLTYGGGLLLVVIALGLGYRHLTGQTMSEQRKRAEMDKAQQELMSKAPGSAEAFSARLANRAEQAEAEEARRREQEKEAQQKPAPILPLPTEPKLTDRLPVGEPTEDPDEYERRRLQAAAEASRRMGSWEAGDKRAAQSAAMSGVDLTALAALSRLNNPSPAATLNDRSAAGGTSSRIAEMIAAATGNGAGTPGVNRDSAFMQQTANQQAASPLRPQQGHGRCSVMEGTAIDVVMRTNVSSDIGGPCRAQVARNVYDTVTGRNLLVPAGATLLCTYNSEVVQGQERLLLAFTRLIYPSGASVQLGAMHGADTAGGVGVPAEVNSRFFKVFGSSFLVAMITKLAETKQDNAQVNVNLSGTTGGAAASVLADVARQSLQRNINIKPELFIPAGDRLRLVVTRDMVLDPAETGVVAP